MTHVQADNLVQKLFGENCRAVLTGYDSRGRVVAHDQRCQIRRWNVRPQAGTHRSFNDRYKVLGRGNTWEEAIAEAKKKNGPPEGGPRADG